MADHSHQFPIAKMSRLFGVSRSGTTGGWDAAPPGGRSLTNNSTERFSGYGRGQTNDTALHVSTDNWPPRDGRLVAPRIARLMSKMGIASRFRRTWVKTTDSKHGWPVAPNLLDRNFAPGGLSEVRTAIFEFIEIWYNRKRLHSALDYRTPAQTGQLLTQNQAA